ncbi:GntR family transcriptional regulator [Peptostreptococcus equinus]|uniref:GntR family transcriptional regulator n=1 Tax=Peptostreptococcus equinus TaxID=3003601 RepID=A0ABY7JNH7_9FIRM|nr:GntR family transcriptional regulator [Peptostreptococcus sp. CBA3647]WAW14892.1 GntR family transcriptional regulator [Peptostreptococcus sp. CBA3647]
MQYNFDNNVPLYIQIIDIIKTKIISGHYEPGQQLEPVRTLAAEFEINPNTIQRALGELENQGLLHSQRTKGRFVTEDVTLIKKLRNKMVIEELEKTIKTLEKMGFKKMEIKEIFIELIDGGISND